MVCWWSSPKRRCSGVETRNRDVARPQNFVHAQLGAQDLAGESDAAHILRGTTANNQGRRPVSSNENNWDIRDDQEQFRVKATGQFGAAPRTVGEGRGGHLDPGSAWDSVEPGETVIWVNDQVPTESSIASIELRRSDTEPYALTVIAREHVRFSDLFDGQPTREEQEMYLRVRRTDINEFLLTQYSATRDSTKDSVSFTTGSHHLTAGERFPRDLRGLVDFIHANTHLDRFEDDFAHSRFSAHLHQHLTALHDPTAVPLPSRTFVAGRPGWTAGDEALAWTRRANWTRPRGPFAALDTAALTQAYEDARKEMRQRPEPDTQLAQDFIRLREGIAQHPNTSADTLRVMYDDAVDIGRLGPERSYTDPTIDLTLYILRNPRADANLLQRIQESTTDHGLRSLAGAELRKRG